MTQWNAADDDIFGGMEAKPVGKFGASGVKKNPKESVISPPISAATSTGAVDNKFIADLKDLSIVSSVSVNQPSTFPSTSLPPPVPTTNPGTVENPFDLFGATPPVQPLSTAGNSEEFFSSPFNSSSVASPPPTAVSTVSTGGNTMSEADFDSFFDSLNKK